MVPEPNWLIPGDCSYWIHAQLDPCEALNIVCSQQLVSDCETGQRTTSMNCIMGKFELSVDYVFGSMHPVLLVSLLGQLDMKRVPMEKVKTSMHFILSVIGQSIPWSEC